MGATATLMDQPDPKVGRLEALQYLQSQVDVGGPMSNSRLKQAILKIYNV